MYNYEELKPELFTEKNQKGFLVVRDRVRRLLDYSGAFTMHNVLGSGSSYLQMACVDRLVEIGEIKEIHANRVTQERIFVWNK